MEFSCSVLDSRVYPLIANPLVFYVFLLVLTPSFPHKVGDFVQFGSCFCCRADFNNYGCLYTLAPTGTINFGRNYYLRLQLQFPQIFLWLANTHTHTHRQFSAQITNELRSSNKKFIDIFDSRLSMWVFTQFYCTTANIEIFTSTYIIYVCMCVCPYVCIFLAHTVTDAHAR